MECVFDLEGDGLYWECTTVHCGVFKNIRTGEVHKFRPDQIDQMLGFMDKCTKLIGHNVLGYDFPVLKKLYNYEFKGEKVDTLCISRMLFPSLQRPKGMKGRVAPHGIEAWGFRFGRYKPENEDWSIFTDHMLHRCSEDVEIQTMLYKHLGKTAKKRGFPAKAFNLTFKLFDILTEQEHNGWLVDEPRIDKYIRMLTRNINRIDSVVVPELPSVVEIPYKVSIEEPFKKSGDYKKTVHDWYGDQVHQVRGPFTRVCFRKVNIASDKEVKDYLLKEGWKPKEWNFKKDKKGKLEKDAQGQPIKTSPKLSADDDFIGVNGRIGRIIAKRIKCVHRRSTLEGWKNNIRPDGRISQVIAGIAATGRLTHNGIVNVPGSDAFFGKQMRSVFTCEDGYVLVGTDSASCQDRMLAGRADDPAFTKMLLDGSKDDGTDGHTLNMKAINKVLERWGKPLINRGTAKNFG